MNKNLNVSDSVKQIKILLLAVKKHHIVIGFISVILLYSFLVFQINILSSVEPTDEEVTQKLEKIKRPIIDKEIVKKIKQLQDENIEVQAIFKQARENPFNE
jgi:hypothetical protein